MADGRQNMNSRQRSDHLSISSGSPTCCSHLCSQVIRTVLFIFNFIFWALGGTLLVLGVYLKIEYKSLDDISDDNFVTWMYGLIIVGSVIFVISFLGCCGTLLQSNNFLMLYFMLLILLVFGQIGCGIWAYTIRDKIFIDLEEGLETAVAEYNNTKSNGNESVIKDSIDSIQTIFKCCGHNGRADYNGDPPRSCCPRTEHDLPHCSEETYHNVGCKEKIPQDVTKNLWLIGIILGVLLFLEIVCGVAYLILKYNSKDSYTLINRRSSAEKYPAKYYCTQPCCGPVSRMLSEGSNREGGHQQMAKLL